MESEDVSTDDDGQRYPGARSRYHPTELKKPGSKQWKVYERFNSDGLLLSLGTARNLISFGFTLIKDWFYRLHLSWPFSSKECNCWGGLPNLDACEQGDQKGMPPAMSSGR